MKKKLCITCYMLINIVICCQGQGLFLTSRLLKSGSTICVEILLKNKSSNNCYCFTPMSNSNKTTGPTECVLIPEIEYKNGTRKYGIGQGFFYFRENEYIYYLKEQNSYTHKIPLLYHAHSETVSGTAGAISYSDIDNVKRIRFVLDKLRAIKKGDNLERVDTVLYSNWLDITP